MTNQDLYNTIKDVEYKILDSENNRKTLQLLNILHIDEVLNQHLNINNHNLSLDLLEQFDKQSFIFITSINPKGQKVSFEENQIAMEQLTIDLNRFLILEAVSVFENNEDENGFIAFDVPFPIAITLLNKYKQNAIVWADKIKTTLLINDFKI